ncbi:MULTISPECIES: transposase [Caballeronia]|uniref:transposase n=1 Tax=Caballeronia TaxID=1827195 RepID=UPI0002F77DD5|nr:MULTISPECIES: transposase [Caballeronia]MCE4546336.1 transposase [Caballeronia sp. PC1]MCE4573189.1 transposase [Caballeronia sp. CLC5]
MWLQSIERKNGRLKGKVIDNEGSVDWVEASSLWRVKMRESGKTKLTLTTNLDDWEVSDSAEYLAFSGAHYWAPGDSHEIYVAHHLGLRLLIPALALTKALFTPNAIFFSHLYRPSSVDQLVAPVRQATGLVGAPVRRDFGRLIGAASGPARMQWTYCFPSAREAFASVYANALRGAIGLTLPKLLADATLTGSLHGQVFVASAMSLQRLEPNEHAFTWAGEQPTQFILSAADRLGAHLNPVLKNSDLIEGPNGWRLANSEWSQLKHIVRPYFVEATKDDRKIVDAILIKLATGMGWRSANGMLGSATKVSTFYRRLRQAGRWEEFEASLLRLRRGDELVPLEPGRHAALFTHNPRIRLRPRKRA